MAIPYLACMALVARIYALPPRVLPAIQAVEGGRVGMVSPNANGTEDYGVMQVNTVWLGPLARLTGSTAARVRERLIAEPCFNIAAAGAIMAAYLREERGALLPAIGDYHSHTAVRNLDYRDKVVSAARRLFQRAGAGDR